MTRIAWMVTSPEHGPDGHSVLWNPGDIIELDQPVPAGVQVVRTITDTPAPAKAETAAPPPPAPAPEPVKAEAKTTATSTVTADPPKSTGRK